MTLSIIVSSVDPAIGRIQKSSLSQQTLMELLVSNLDDKTLFQDSCEAYIDVSTWPTLTYTNGSVTQIDWTDESYEATRNTLHPGGSIDLYWIPDTVTDVSISFLLLHGSIETVFLPKALESLSLIHNNFSGTFSIKDLPRTLNWIDIDGNQLTGSLTLTFLPPTLRVFQALENSFSGSIDLTKLPETLEHLSLNDNGFEGTVNLSQLPPALEFLELNGNRFHTSETRLLKSTTGCAFLSIDENVFSRILDENGNERIWSFNPDRGRVEVWF